MGAARFDGRAVRMMNDDERIALCCSVAKLPCCPLTLSRTIS